MIPSFLRGKLAGWKKKSAEGERGWGGGTPCDRLVGCVPEFRLQGEGDGVVVGVETVHSGGVCMLEPPRENVEELVIKRPRNTAAQSLVLHPVCRFIIAPFAFNNQLPLPFPPLSQESTSYIHLERVWVIARF